MKEWCLVHPWMTFFIILFTLQVIGQCIEAFFVAISRIWGRL